MASRRKGRVAAFQAIYACESGAVPDDLEFNWTHSQSDSDPEWVSFAKLLFRGTLDNLSAIDSQISRHLQHWDITRIRKVDLAILRISTYALLYQRGIPHSVTIDEAVHIAKEFGTDESYRFINGVLDAIRRDDNAPSQSAKQVSHP
ncbi:MAG: transcription antitermination factor NusB [Spirochaeta sp.]